MSSASETTFIRLLDVDPGLGAGLTEEDRALARAVLVANVKPVSEGVWVPEPPESPGSHLGFLVVEGILFRRMPFGERESAELVGAGDLLRPWHELRSASVFETTASWTVVEPAVLAVLDGRVTGTIGRWPQLVAAMVGRALERSRAMALTLGIAQMPGVELRLLATLWDLAERFGHREADDCVVPIRLTYPMLSVLVRTHRTTVAKASWKLGEMGLAERRDDGYWVVRGAPPEGLAALRRAVDG